MGQNFLHSFFVIGNWALCFSPAFFFLFLRTFFNHLIVIPYLVSREHLSNPKCPVHIKNCSQHYTTVTLTVNSNTHTLCLMSKRRNRLRGPTITIINSLKVIKDNTFVSVEWLTKNLSGHYAINDFNLHYAPLYQRKLILVNTWFCNYHIHQNNLGAERSINFKIVFLLKEWIYIKSTLKTTFSFTFIKQKAIRQKAIYLELPPLSHNSFLFWAVCVYS